MAKRFALDALLVDPDEMQIIGNDDVLRQALVASDLIGFQNVVEIFADTLVLDVSEDETGLGDLEIRGALIDYPLWFMLDSDGVWGRVGERL